MPVITRALLRKRSEHNEGIISTMQELTLHQEELENINEVLGMTCRSLKILMLQNNIISRMENLVHLKELEYLNLALNNVKKIEGLQNCEFLNKIDLTVNFVDVDELEASIDHLSSRDSLKDLYMMGNPCQVNWPGFTSFVIAKLPQLKTLDGTEITRSLQIQARQKLPVLEIELRQLASKKREELAIAAKLTAAAAAAEKESGNVPSEGKERSKVVADEEILEVDETSRRQEEDSREKDRIQEDRDKLTENTPEVRQEIYRELAQQKKEKSDRESANAPKERNAEKEQKVAIEAVRQKEEMDGESEVKQKNEGGWEFKWDEETRNSFISLEVFVPRHLDSSLMDVDVHPTYISIVIKSKVLRLRLPAEVKSGESKCQRSKVTGSLLIIMPKVNPKENSVTLRGDAKQKEKENEKRRTDSTQGPMSFDTGGSILGGRPGSSTLRGKNIPPKQKIAVVKKLSIQEQMLADAISCREIVVESCSFSGLNSDSSLSSGSGTVDRFLEFDSTSTSAISSLKNITNKNTKNKREEESTITIDSLEKSDGESLPHLTGLTGGIEELD